MRRAYRAAMSDFWARLPGVTGETLWHGIETIVCDLDGVVYLGEQGIPGAGDALAALADAGLQLLFVTNNSTKTQQDTADKIERTSGFAPDPASVVTSALVTAARLAGHVESAYVVGAQSIVDALASHGIASVDDWSDAGAVVVGLDREVSYDRLSAATLAIRGGALFYATNSDSTLPTPHGLLPGAGAIVAAIATAAEQEPVVSGKPNQTMIDHVAAQARGEILVVGDRLNTDIAMANRAGWRSAMVLSGISSLEDVDGSVAPDFAVGSLPELAALRA